MSTSRRIGVILAMTGLLAGTLVVSAAPLVLGATTCRVRNVTQGSTGTSLIRMVERAVDGDLIRVRGTCPGEVVIDVDLVIRGVRDSAVLTGRDRTRVVRVEHGARVTLRDLTIEHGLAFPGGGGGILNRGRLRLADVIVQDNVADLRCDGDCGLGSGGGIENRSRLTVIDSVIRRNIAPYFWGGGIWSHGGGSRLVLRRSLVAGNGAPSEGGGIHAVRATIIRSVIRGNRASYGGGINGGGYPGGSVALFDSTVRDNEAYEGAGVWINGTLRLTDSAVTGNVADDRGGGIWSSAGLVLVGSVISGNTADRKGGGIWNQRPGTVTLDAGSSVFGNVPDDCVGTDAC